MENTPAKGFFASSLFKGMVTLLLMLGMLIPVALVSDLVQERKQRQLEVIEEVSSKWAGQQTLSGPFLLVPYTQTIQEAGKPVTVRQNLVVLPQQLHVQGAMQPHLKRRSIYQVALYEAQLQVTGNFDLAQVKPESGQTLLWAEARLCLGVSDTRGIAREQAINWGGSQLQLDAGLPDNHLAEQGMSVAVNLAGAAAAGPISFQVPLVLKGSEKLQVLPLGKNTTCDIRSTWASPSFVGAFLPRHQLADSGFAASWSVLHYNRSFPQVWTDGKNKAADYAFGVSLLQPTDHYAKTSRSTKYAILIIWLSFGFFFLLEMLLNQQVHPVQYTLVGIALVVFYTLLLSIGEVSAFNLAYGLAAAATVLLITLYSKYLFGGWKYGCMIGGFLAVLYGFVFGLIQLEDTALLAGSLGLFVLVALAMYLSRKVDWHGARSLQPTPPAS